MNIFARVFRFIGRKTTGAIYNIAISIPFFRFVKETKNTQVPATFNMWFIQKVLGFNRKAYWPVHHSSKINQPKNICIGVETSPGYEPGCYIQGIGKVYIGDYTQIAQNVGIISSNHDFYQNNHHILEEVIIGKYSWLGMNSVILPGVKLGPFTVVGAGAVVTKSFSEGYCVIGGNPAKVIKYLDKEKCVEYKSEYEYCGYIRKDKFEEYRKKNLWI